MPRALEASINQESSRFGDLATILETIACASEIVSISFPQLLTIWTIPVTSGPVYWYPDKILSRTLNALGMCAGSTAFAHTMARKSLTDAGSKSDENVLSNNPISALASLSRCQ